MISVLEQNLVDAYMQFPTGKELWDMLEAKFSVSDVGSELCMSWNSSMTNRWLMIILQSNKLMSYKRLQRSLTTSCNLLEKFVVNIIAKLPPS